MRQHALEAENWLKLHCPKNGLKQHCQSRKRRRKLCLKKASTLE